MCNTEVADKAIQKVIAELSKKVGSFLNDDDATIERIAKLRASMNPTIVQKD